MYLLNAAQINSTLSNQPTQGQAQSTGLGDISRYEYVLGLVKTRVEEIMEVASFTRATTVDHFEITGRNTETRILRLSSAFLTQDPADFLLTDDKEQVLDESVVVDREKGLVYVALPRGRYRVAYASGFTADDEGMFQDVPDWLQSIAKNAVALHYRLTTSASATPINVKYVDLLNGIRREMNARSSARWQRPRIGATFPLMSTRNGQ